MTKVVVVAGTQSGSGKTLTSLAILSALVRRGLVVQAFKVGPDFIDPGHHAAITGRPSLTLDGWMTDRQTVCDTVARYTAQAAVPPDVAVVEGVMGVFDGASGTSDEGSTAEVAKWMGAPVLLVVDARSMARSVAAVVHGYTTLDPELAFAGVVLNRVGSENHADLLREALRSACPDVPLLGCLGRREALTIPSRHLGLVTADDHAFDADTRNAMADWLEDAVDVPGLLSLLPDIPPALPRNPPEKEPSEKEDVARIGVARDAAFCFYYEENLRLLAEAGAELCFFSPLTASKLPTGLDGLYLGGGYPELHAHTLSANEGLRREIREFSRSGNPIYAECGGFMYLMRELRTAEGEALPMCGCFAMRCRMDARFRALGYREIVTMAPSPLGPAWVTARGHEFHYSHMDEADPGALAVYKVRDRRGWRGESEGFMRDNTLGSYVHLHFASNPDVARNFVEACIRARSTSRNRPV